MVAVVVERGGELAAVGVGVQQQRREPVHLGQGRRVLLADGAVQRVQRAPLVPQEQLVPVQVGELEHDVPCDEPRPAQREPGIDAEALDVLTVDLAGPVPGPHGGRGAERPTRAGVHVGDVEGERAGLELGVDADPPLAVVVLGDDVVEIGRAHV